MISCQDFPETVEEFMEEYKMVDTEKVYSNGTEFVPIFRMEQWFEHEKNKRAECQYIVSKGTYSGTKNYKCTKCGDSFSWTQNEFYPWRFNYCRNCGAKVTGCIEAEADHDPD